MVWIFGSHSGFSSPGCIWRPLGSVLPFDAEPWPVDIKFQGLVIVKNPEYGNGFCHDLIF